MIGGNRNRACVFLGALALMLCGCVHQEIAGNGEPASRTTLTVTRSGETVQLSWKSEVGKVYDILYTDKLSGQPGWKVLPGAANLRGTGENITFSDSIDSGLNRYYRLNITLASQRENTR